MKNRRKKTGVHAVLLPWERKRAFFGEVLSGRHWGFLLLATLAALAAIAAWNEADGRAKTRSTRASIAEVQRAITAFRAELGRCPRSKTELAHPPRAVARYLAEIPKDGWGRELLVRCPAPHDSTTAEVISAGPSGSFSDDDNVL